MIITSAAAITTQFTFSHGLATVQQNASVNNSFMAVLAAPGTVDLVIVGEIILT